jgi:hypothetical protein
MACYGNISVHNCKALLHVVKMAQYITGTVPSPIQDICQRKARSILKDPTQIHHKLSLIVGQTILVYAIRFQLADVIAGAAKCACYKLQLKCCNT